MAKTEMINSIKDLINYWGWSSDTPIESLPKMVYKGTDCGAWIQLQTEDGEWHGEGELTGIGEVIGFRIGTIVEGSDADVGPQEFTFPVTANEVQEWINEMESEASFLWHEANDDYDEDDEGDDL